MTDPISNDAILDLIHQMPPLPWTFNVDGSITDATQQTIGVGTAKGEIDFDYLSGQFIVAAGPKILELLGEPQALPEPAPRPKAISDERLLVAMNAMTQTLNPEAKTKDSLEDFNPQATFALRVALKAADDMLTEN